MVFKYIDFRHFSIAKKLSVWGIIFLAFLFIIVILNNSQFKILGIETIKITTIEVPAINELKKLDSQIYQQTILRQLIFSMNEQQNEKTFVSIADKQSIIKKYNENSLLVSASHLKISTLMKDYAKLEMPSKERRWKRLQTKHQNELQISFDLIAESHAKQQNLAKQSFTATTLEQLQLAKTQKSEMSELDTVLHQEVEKLSRSAIIGVESSGKKIENIEYGARQMTYFLLFWFYLIGIVCGYFIIRMVTSKIKQSNILANKIANGNYSDTAEVNSQDELGNLLQTLNGIAQTLEGKNQDRNQDNK